MPLTLILRAVPGAQMNTPAPARVGDTRLVTDALSIGRAPVNDWVLVDPLLSKKHCIVAFRDGGYVLTDLSTNGVFVDGGKRLAKGGSIALTDGDSFTLGGYVVAVRAEADGNSTIVTAGSAIGGRAEDTGKTRSPGGRRADNPAGRARSPFDEQDRGQGAPSPRPMGAAGGDAGRLIAAFLDGAGVPADTARGDPESYMRGMGALLRLMIERVRDILIARAGIKHALGVEQTLLRARDNNALKFSATPEDAVAALLLPGRPGTLPPLQAARAALDDIESHQRAVMAGVQTALSQLLRRFDPAVLEQRLTRGSILDNIVPGARKARMWELFCATYDDIAAEAETDLTAVLGPAFAQGYRAPKKPISPKE